MSETRNWKDLDYASDVTSVQLRGPEPRSRILLICVILFFAAAFIWAQSATVEEVTRGEGRVIPSSQIQIIQNLEGGILKEILVQEGQVVKKGQILLRIDDTGFASSYGEQRARYFALLGQVSRLLAEAEARPLEFPPELVAEARKITVNERKLFNARSAELKSQLSILRDQANQRKQELAELHDKVRQVESSLVLLLEELAMTEPLAKKGVVPKIDLLRLKRQVNDLEGEAGASRLAIPRAKSAMRESNRRIEERYLTFRVQARRELNATQAEFAQIEQTILAAKDRVARTDIRSPVRGVVKQLKISTIGGVVQPGMDLLEIVPLDDTLLVEVQIKPADVAFLRPGQDATVKLTAYDFSIYGGLPAKLERISADTIVDEKGDSYYRIIVRTEKNHLVYHGKVLPIIPGMVASVDTLTGYKTILDYILKPILKTRERALRER